MKEFINMVCMIATVKSEKFTFIKANVKHLNIFSGRIHCRRLVDIRFNQQRKYNLPTHLYKAVAAVY